jgi:2-keto-4-pentenoate hydratase/2-oxohepta-3-ene-1,7-dioic acid hydratase in catechol pathway
MKIIRYADRAGDIRYSALDADGGAKRIEGDVFDEAGDWRLTDEAADVRKLLAPVAPPTIFCIGLNYRRHAEEIGAKIPQFPVLFMKGANAVQHPGDPILLPSHLRSEQVDYECELVIVIGRRCKNVSRAEALDYVLGYMCGNDVSARDWQKDFGGSQWCRGKTFDTFAPLGPCVVTPDEIPEPDDLAIKTVLNGETVQDWRTNDMIFDVRTLIEFLSGSTTLLPGTIIFTGTPHGVGMARNPPLWLKAGDRVVVEIEKIGRLENPVEVEAPLDHAAGR